MSSDPLELNESRAAYFARWEAVETVKAQELAAMTEERARQIIQSLGAVEGWREQPDWSGLVEQQALFHKGLSRSRSEAFNGLQPGPGRTTNP